MERIIGSGLALFDRIRKSDLESIVSQSHGIEELPTFTENELQETILAVCRNEMYADSPHQLARRDLLWLARTLVRRFSATRKQISRLLGIDTAVLDNVL